MVAGKMSEINRNSLGLRDQVLQSAQSGNLIDAGAELLDGELFSPNITVNAKQKAIDPRCLFVIDLMATVNKTRLLMEKMEKNG